MLIENEIFNHKIYNICANEKHP